ncbi:hypothetical protein D8674_027240 [Pyrus ussuriensis x Pyrus communis]|uniref:Uncharacterized protein n=1 Tax=Pyrus ussuriensis x Pyrus communis TaxID=2448454 RepID=A0A5N5I955_9ROSA|nr:hypothetical protein D8674_027232 [Pyrus ussuriensis x Pyrus communis]KAB2636706.1 hypothetical protein D8674_027240 [Pyrus ussuriensis x Pyrus communis]
MKFLKMFLVAVFLVVFLMNMQSSEACRVLHGEEKFMHQMKNDVLHQMDRPFFPLIRQILRGTVPPGGPNPTKP